MQNGNWWQEKFQSLNQGKQIDISGFEQADHVTHMIEWIWKGNDFRKFIANDIETELYTQDPGAQLLSVACKSQPNIETKAQHKEGDNRATVVQMSIAFPVFLRVQSTDGKIWGLNVNHSYHATNMDTPDQFQLRLDFTVCDYQIEQI